MPDHLALLAGLMLVFLLAGLVKGVIGLGLPTVAMAFLTLMMPPAEAATVLVLPSFVTMSGSLPGRSSPRCCAACGPCSSPARSRPSRLPAGSGP